jgi:3-methyladenine DNA glycosylase AlkC
MTVCLRDSLPQAYPDALAIILQALPPELDPALTDDDFGEFIIAPYSHFVALYGCTREHLAISLAALREITKRFTAENAIRFFINAFPAETLAFLDDCARDDNYHVRRLASEGSRPKLPWAQKLVIDYREPLPLLTQLHADPTRYVTRSVANHLNDISKIDPELVVSTLTSWQADGRQAAGEMDFITRHSLRSLIKQGHDGALALLGYGDTPDITILTFQTATPEVKIGEAFHFTLALKANKPQKLLIDYQMQFASNGSRPGQKIFKLKQLELATGEIVTIEKKHPLRLMTTRRLYPGKHQIQLQINGQPYGSLGFELRG